MPSDEDGLLAAEHAARSAPPSTVDKGKGPAEDFIDKANILSYDNLPQALKDLQAVLWDNPEECVMRGGRRWLQRSRANGASHSVQASYDLIRGIIKWLSELDLRPDIVGREAQAVWGRHIGSAFATRLTVDSVANREAQVTEKERELRKEAESRAEKLQQEAADLRTRIAAAERGRDASREQEYNQLQSQHQQARLQQQHGQQQQ